MHLLVCYLNKIVPEVFYRSDSNRHLTVPWSIYINILSFFHDFTDSFKNIETPTE